MTPAVEFAAKKAALPAPPLGGEPKAPSIMIYDNRIRIAADVDIAGAKDLIKKLQRRIDLLEEEADEAAH
jgi:hypothetical protein